jgi:hypothetical protein
MAPIACSFGRGNSIEREEKGEKKRGQATFLTVRKYGAALRTDTPSRRHALRP